MGAVGSVCCQEQTTKERKKENDKNHHQPTVPSQTPSGSSLLPPKKIQKKPEAPSPPPKENSLPNIPQKAPPPSKPIPTSNPSKASTNPTSSKLVVTSNNGKQIDVSGATKVPPTITEAQKIEDVAEVIEKMYPAPKAVKWQSFDVIGKIGSGGFGEVFLAELKENKAKGINEKYAIKRVIKNQIYRKKLTANIKLEKKILQESKSKFITTLYYAFRDDHYLYFVMEWAPGGDTYTLINEASPRLNDFKKAGEEAVRFILGCLILGMEYLHSKNIMYRDLKPENVLIFENGYAKLTDFGLAKEIREDQLSRTEAGTTIYYAPQMVLKEGYQKEIDIWAIGVYAYEMSNYFPPFASADIKEKLKVKRVVKQAQNKRIWKNPNISDQLKDFINAILKFDPKERLGYKGFDQMKNHPFFTKANFNWTELEEMKMKSPLKQIIDAHKIKCKPYNPNEVNKKLMSMANAGKSQEPECWTYARDKND